LKVNVLKRKENELKIEVEGAGHTICNLLQKKLLEDENVDMAGYDIPHPLASNPIIYVRTKGGVTPEQALRRAVEKLLELSDEFSRELEKALKK
jgi:DNA-directed RNA polymerase subunit L